MTTTQAVALAGPPHLDLEVDNASEPSLLHPAIKGVCRQLLHGWKALEDAAIEVGGWLPAAACAALGEGSP